MNFFGDLKFVCLFCKLESGFDFEVYYSLLSIDNGLNYIIFEFCDMKFSEYILCEDVECLLKYLWERLIYREWYCFGKDELFKCLIFVLVGYKNLFLWF